MHVLEMRRHLASYLAILAKKNPPLGTVRRLEIPRSICNCSSVLQSELRVTAYRS